MAQHYEQKSLRYAQTCLARSVTLLVHGMAQAGVAERVTDYLIGMKLITEADETILAELREELPVVHTRTDGSILQTLVDSGLAESISEARRLVQSNAVALDGVKVSRESFTSEDFHERRLLIKKGKKFRDTALVELIQ